MDCIQLKIVVEKFGERSCAFAKVVMLTALAKPSEIVISTTHIDGSFGKKIRPIRQALGMKLAVNLI